MRALLSVADLIGQFLCDALGKIWSPASWPKWLRRTYLILLPIGFCVQLILSAADLVFFIPMGICYIVWIKTESNREWLGRVWRGEVVDRSQFID